MITSALSLLAVGILWGATNPFIRLGSEGIEKIDTGSEWRNLLAEMRMVTKRLRYWIPVLLNQAGSVLYMWTLQSTSMAIAVPVANSLSFAFTGIAGYLLGEGIPGKRVVFGTILVCTGSVLMIYDQVMLEQQAQEI